MPTTLNSASPLVTFTQKSLNDLNTVAGDSLTGKDPESGAKVQEKVTKVHDDLDELYATAFNELEV